MAPRLDNFDDYEEAIRAYATSATPSSVAETAKRVTAPDVQHFQSLPSKTDRDIGMIGSNLWQTMMVVVLEPSPDPARVSTRMVELLDAVKALGTLEHEGQPCKTSAGTAWTDLPYFGLEMRECWNDSPPRMNEGSWARINAFAARLTSTNVYPFDLFGLWSIRSVLEAPLPYLDRDLPEKQDSSDPHDQGSMTEHLPAALEWFSICGSSMLAWCGNKKSYKLPTNDPGALGRLAKEDGVVETGYNTQRWEFWKKRLHQISQEKGDTGRRDMAAKLATQCLEAMSAAEQQRQSARS